MLSTCQILLVALVSGVLLMTSQTQAWSQWVDEENDGWSHRSCAQTHTACTRTVKCCNPRDMCIYSAKRNSAGSRIGFCTSTASLRAYGGKRALMHCTSSQECADGCCREYRKHRVGKIFICGTPQNEFTTFNCA